MMDPAERAVRDAVDLVQQFANDQPDTEIHTITIEMNGASGRWDLCIEGWNDVEEVDVVMDAEVG